MLKRICKIVFVVLALCSVALNIELYREATSLYRIAVAEHRIINQLQVVCGLSRASN